MIAERLYHFGEKNGIFNSQQAGFRKGRGCEDQISRIIQAIQDGFKERPMKRSVLVLLDFSKAYDTVWREKLLTTMLDTGVPVGILRWVYRFLEDRRAKVKCNGTASKSHRMRQGVPQGTIIHPLPLLHE